MHNAICAMYTVSSSCTGRQDVRKLSTDSEGLTAAVHASICHFDDSLHVVMALSASV